MRRAGQRTSRVAFERLAALATSYANLGTETWGALFTVWGKLRETSGRERVEGGAVAAPMTARLWVDSSSLTRQVTEKDSAVIDGVRWNIRSIADPDQRRAELEMVLERGVA